MNQSLVLQLSIDTVWDGVHTDSVSNQVQNLKLMDMYENKIWKYTHYKPLILV